MINELLLENFKLFGKETHLAGLKSMNLLTGVNGRGKSSALQPLLLFKQTLLRSRSSRQIFLSGSFVDLGNASDVKHVDASVTRPIRIGFKEKEETYVYTFGIADENNQSLDIQKFESIGNTKWSVDVDNTTIFHDLVPENGDASKLMITFQGVIYISAERIGPKMSFAASSDKEFCSVFLTVSSASSPSPPQETNAFKRRTPAEIIAIFFRNLFIFFSFFIFRLYALFFY